MKRIVTLLALGCSVAVGAFAFAPAAGADPVPVGGVWQEFHFNDTGSFATGCGPCVPSSSGNSAFAPAAPWTFTLSGAGTLTVTDAFTAGDVFEVFDFGVSLGTTSTVPTDFGCASDDPVQCVGVNSSGTWTLTPGPHSITIEAVASPYTEGAGYFLVQAASQASFAGTPGHANCVGQSVAALNKQYGNLAKAAAALGYPNVDALQKAIKAYCG
jgi:hypothetical protein